MSITPIAWSSEILANSGATTDVNSGITQTGPAIAGLSNGNFVVLWEDPVNNADSSLGRDIIGQIFDPLGARVGGFFQANSFDEDGEREVATAALTDGNFVVVYVDEDSTTSSIRFDILSPTGANIRSGTVVSKTFSGGRENGRVFEPRVDALEDGTFAVTWHDRSTGFLSQTDRIQTRFYTEAGSSIRTQTLFDIEDSEGFDSAARFDDYILYAAADQGFGLLGTPRIQIAARETDGSAPFAIRTLTGPSDETWRNVVIAPVSAGGSNAHAIAWQSDDGGNTRIKISLFSNNGVVVNERLITPSTVTALNPDIIRLSDDGSFFVVWDNVTNDRIEGLRFDGAGNQVGTVRTIASGVVSQPGLSETGDGRILVTWVESGDIRTRIFDPRDGQVVGTPGNDVLTFLANAASTLIGLAGNDMLFGSTFSDSLVGDEGNDTLFGGDGNDRLSDGAGNDIVFGGAGNDTFFGSLGADSYVGGSGNDRVDYTASPAGVQFNLASLSATGTGGFAEGDSYSGIENAIGSNFADRITGTIGDNTLSGMGGNDSLLGGGGDDNLRGFSGNDSLSGGSGNDVLIGDEGNDILTGSSGIDRLFGGSGNDTLRGGSGADSMDGGTGVDTLDYSDSTAGVLISLASGQASGGFADGDAFSAMENVIGSRHVDTLIGNSGANRLDGFAGADTLEGGAGNDTYIVRDSQTRIVEGANAGFDTVQAAVDLTLAAGVSIEELRSISQTGLRLGGNELSQIVFGGSGNDTLSDGGGAGDVLQGNGGDDLIIVRSAASIVLEAAGQGVDRVAAGVSYSLRSFEEIEQLTTTSAGATTRINLTGNQLSQTITGNAGANVLADGGGSPDQLRGLGGNDTYIVRAAGTKVLESAGQGNDKVAAAVNFALDAGVEVETLTTTSSAGTAALGLTGNSLAQRIIGNAGANTLSDGGGAGDTLQGLGGDDFYIVRSSATRVVELAGGGKDRVAAAVDFALGAADEVEVMTTTSSGGTAAIDLTGSATIQTIVGNAGANRIDGKAGSDTLTGLGGPDTFVFSTALGASNFDRVTDFAPGEDRIALDDAIFTGLALGTLSSTVFRANTTGQAQDADDRIIYNTTDGFLYFDPDGLGGAGRIRFADLEAGLAISATDIVVF